MIRAIAIVFLLCLASCKTRGVGPDPSLFPNKSEDWKEGFQTGFYEGLTYQQILGQ